VVLPHPIYASQGWVSILNPAERTGTELQRLVDDAYNLAERRHARRREAH
jgi:predicted DNA-binding protein (MmcQ/YjbR family)